MENKGKFYQDLPENEQKAGWIKFNIPAPEEGMESLNGEGVWGWLSPKDYKKWEDDEFRGKLTAILLNEPLNFAGQLSWGTEVVIRCHGQYRPTLDVEWAKENLVFPEPGVEKTYRIGFSGGDEMLIVATSLYDAIREAMIVAQKAEKVFTLESWEELGKPTEDQ